LVVAEIALSMILVTGAGLLARSFTELRRTPVGFDPSNVLTGSVSLPRSYRTAEQAADFSTRVQATLRLLPDVEAASVVRTLPLTGDQPFLPFTIQSQAGQEARREQRADYQVAGIDYLRAMRIRLVLGRWFDERDQAAAPRVAVVNEAFVRQYLATAGPLGRRIGINGPAEIIGVVGDVRRRSVEQPSRPEIYVAEAQNPIPEMAFVVRGRGETETLTSALGRAVAQVDPSLPLFGVRTMESIVAGTVSERRLNLLLLGSFAILALLLAAGGLYGVVSYIVSQRTAEFGLRMALGAQRADVLGLILRQSFRMTLGGVALGMAGMVIPARAFAGLLYRVKPLDPVTYGMAAAVLSVVALTACWLPAKKAIGVEPIEALRYE
jgi:putative ABC transport system permease protein